MKNETEEKVVAVLESPNTSVEDESEKELSQEIETIATGVTSVVITNDDEFEQAAEIVRSVKRQADKVTKFFKPLKEAAHKAHKEICNREKEMLAPLTQAEKEVKTSMSDYQIKVEEARKAEEARLKALAEKEMNEQLDRAAELESQGDIDAANAAMMNAEVAEQFTSAAMPVPSGPKPNGVTQSYDYEIEITDESKVPVSIGGALLRPVDMAAVKRYIKANNGNVQIDGISFKKVPTFSIRK